MNVNLDIKIRPATLADREFIISLVPRLAEFGPPDWRDPELMTEVDAGVLTSKLLNNPEGTLIFIAEDEHGVRLGFIHLQSGNDYYNQEKHGHIADIIVAPEGEGRGIGSQLLKKAEEWARSSGYRWLTLSVFAQNLRAREVYLRHGFGEDMIKYVKVLD